MSKKNNKNITYNDDFPSFLRSDASEKKDVSIDDLLDEEDTNPQTLFQEDGVSVPQSNLEESYTHWNDGFSEEEKTDQDTLDETLNTEDLKLPGWDSENFTDDDFEPLEDLATEPTIINETDRLVPYEDVSQKITKDNTKRGKKISTLADSKKDKNKNEVFYQDPEEYMSLNVPLSDIGGEEIISQEKEEPSEMMENPSSNEKETEEKLETSDAEISEVDAKEKTPKSKEKIISEDAKRRGKRQEENVSQETTNEEFFLEEKTNSDEEEVQKNSDTFASKETVENFVHAEDSLFSDDKKLLDYLKWYSGSIADDYFVVSKDNDVTDLIGNSQQNAIYINIGTSAYGWNIAFENGMMMNLLDVREFQYRNGKIPHQAGTIIYGPRHIHFANIERIVIGMIPEYFHYGI